MKTVLATTITVLSLALISLSANAQERTIENTSIDKPMALAKMKEGVIYHGMRVLSFQDWTAKHKTEKSVMNLYPNYTEPVLLKDRDGVRKTEVAKLTMFIARSSFIINKPARAIESKNFINADFVKKIDPTINHTPINQNDLITYRVEAQKQNRLNNAQGTGQWCDNNRQGICLDSTYNYPTVIAAIVNFYNAFKAARKDAFTRTQSELRAITPQELQASADIKKLTGLSSAIQGGLEQNIFYFNQMMQFGTIRAFFQEHPTDANKTVVTALFALGVETHIFEQFGDSSALAATNLQPKQYIMGESPFNRGQSGLGAGLPTFTRSMTDLMARELEK